MSYIKVSITSSPQLYHSVYGYLITNTIKKTCNCRHNDQILRFAHFAIMQSIPQGENNQQWRDRLPYANSRLLYKLCEMLHIAIDDGVRTAIRELNKKGNDGYHLSDNGVITIIFDEINKACDSFLHSDKFREARMTAIEFAEMPDANEVQPYKPFMRILIEASSLDRQYHKQVLFLCQTTYDLYHDTIYDTFQTNQEVIFRNSLDLHKAIRSITRFIRHSCLEVRTNSLDLVNRARTLNQSTFGARSSIDSSAASTSQSILSELNADRSSSITEQSLSPDLSRSGSMQPMEWKTPSNEAETLNEEPSPYPEGSRSNHYVVVLSSSNSDLSLDDDDTDILSPTYLEEVRQELMGISKTIDDVIEPMDDAIKPMDEHAVIEPMEEQALTDTIRKSRKGKSKAQDDDYDFLDEPRIEIDDHSSDSDYVEPKAGKKRKKRCQEAIAKIRKVHEFDLGEPDLTAPKMDYEQIIKKALNIVKSKMRDYSPLVQHILQTRSQQSIVEQVKNGMLVGAIGLLEYFANGYLVLFEDLQNFPSVFPDNDLPIVMLSLVNWNNDTSTTATTKCATPYFRQNRFASGAIISSTTCPKRSIHTLKDKLLATDVVPTLLGKCSDGTQLAQIALFQSPPYESDLSASVDENGADSKKKEQDEWRKMPFFLEPNQNGTTAEDIRDALMTIVENIFVAAFWLFQTDGIINHLSRTAFPRETPLVGLNDGFKTDPFRRETQAEYMRRRKKGRSQNQL